MSSIIPGVIIPGVPGDPILPSPHPRPAEFRRADGTKVIGLSRQADGRWRITATGEVFFEPDENLALGWFERTMEALRGEQAVKLPLRTGGPCGGIRAAA